MDCKILSQITVIFTIMNESKIFTNDHLAYLFFKLKTVFFSFKPDSWFNFYNRHKLVTCFEKKHA